MYKGRIDCSFVVCSVRYDKCHKQDYIYLQQEMMRIGNLLVITFLGSRLVSHHNCAKRMRKASSPRFLSANSSQTGLLTT